jgi:peptidoglycan/LPS O-acetylase OafA/YrhL
MLVITEHTLQRMSRSHPVPFWTSVLSNAALGVFIFFVISGYLITTLLLREKDKTSTISLKSFYLRRAFRILPPLYVYIVFIALLGLTGHLPGVNTRELLTAFTFTRNYVSHVGLWAFEHLWSICIEEQFYLLWPALLVFCLVHRRTPQARRLATHIALGVILIEPFIRVLSFRFLPHFHNPGAFHMRADCLMFGALAALQQGHARFERFYAWMTRVPWLLPIVLFLISGALGMKFQNYWNLPIGITINGILILVWLLWLVRNPQSLSGRLFNQPAVAWLGRLSYSLYIWQTFFLHYRNIVIFGHDHWWSTIPALWLGILLVAVFSYYCIEQPSLRLRDVFLRHMHWHET